MLIVWKSVNGKGPAILDISYNKHIVVMVSPLYIKIYSKHTKTAYWAKMSIFQAFLVKISNFELSNWVPLLLCSIRSSNYSNIDSIIKYDTLICRNNIFDLISPLIPLIQLRD